jgi:hypothetical protein
MSIDARILQAFAGYAYNQLNRMEAFDLDRMAEYESLTGRIQKRGPLTEVLEADKFIGIPMPTSSS